MTTWREMAPEVPPLGGAKKWHVFLSYRSVNRPWVINLYDVLRTHGFRVFLDQVVLKAGDPLIRKIQENLDGSQAAVLIWSKEAAESDWVEAEFDMMAHASIQSGFSFVPIQLDDHPLPSFAATKKSLGFQAYPDGPNGGELLSLMWALVGKTPPEDALRFSVEHTEAARSAVAAVKAAIDTGNAKYLRAEAVKDELVWTTTSSTACLAAEGLVKLGEYEAALEVIDVLEGRFPRAIRPKQLEALARARRGGPGDLEAAQTILGMLYNDGERDPETVGMYARTFKDRYEATNDLRFLRKARELYEEAFEGAPDDYYVGVNAATMNVIIGGPKDLAAAETIAKRVQEVVGEKSVPGDYWRTATIAEILLMRREFTRAAGIYQSAVDTAPSETGSHSTTLRQARKLMDGLQPGDADRKTIEDVFAHLGAKQ